MSDHEFERVVVEWIEDGSDRTPKRAIDGVLLAIKTTPQERDLRIPWRLPFMTAIPRATGIAAVALVAVVGVGGLVFLNNRAPGVTGAPAPATPAPTVAPTPTPTLAPGITGWAPYTSEAYGITLAYPEGYEVWPASREAQLGDPDDFDTTDVFASNEDDIGLSFRIRPAGKSADLSSVEGLMAWAMVFCGETGALDCDPPPTDLVEPLCLSAGGDPCRPAILVRSGGGDPAEIGEAIFFPYWPSETFTGDPDKVVIVSAGRGDAWPGAAKYGGSVALLKSFASQFGVTDAP